MYMFICVRNLSVCSANLKNLYQTLGLTPKATQADIKSAYYKLSLVYHPDKNKGSKQAHEKFQSITAAYEVLGNYTRRKLYDKGMFVEHNVNIKSDIPRSEHIINTHKTVSTGRSPIYNFDEWSRSHYGQSFARRNAAKIYHMNQTENIHVDKRGNIMFAMILFCMTLYIISNTIQESHDQAQKISSKKLLNQDSEKSNKP